MHLNLAISTFTTHSVIPDNTTRYTLCEILQYTTDTTLPAARRKQFDRSHRNSTRSWPQPTSLPRLWMSRLNWKAKIWERVWTWRRRRKRPSRVQCIMMESLCLDRYCAALQSLLRSTNLNCEFALGYHTCERWEEDCARRNQSGVCGQYRCVFALHCGHVKASTDLSHYPLELFYDRGHHHEFLSLSQELAAPGEMRSAQTFEFMFKNVEKQFESYQGINVKLRCVVYKYSLSWLSSLLTSSLYRYFMRVSISRRIADVTKEKDIWVHSFRMPPDSNNSIKMEVGIEDCLHIEFEYNKSKYALLFFPRKTTT